MHGTINKLNVILSIILFSTAAVFFVFLQNNNLENNSNITSEVCLENKCFNVEIADSSKERETGLMNREYLDPDSGMFFVFDKMGVYKFWMKNTLIPLDIIWIDENNKIIFIKENAEPCKVEQCETFGSDEKAKYILEINGGLTDEMGLGVGDEINFK